MHAGDFQRRLLLLLFILGALWGLMKMVTGQLPYFIKARSLFSAKCGIINVVNFPLCLRNFFGKLV